MIPSQSVASAESTRNIASYSFFVIVSKAYYLLLNLELKSYLVIFMF
jgi:hypothetical protein